MKRKQQREDEDLKRLRAWWPRLPEYVRLLIIHRAMWGVAMSNARVWSIAVPHYGDPIIIGG